MTEYKWANLCSFQLTNVFDYCERISHYLTRMVVICKPIDYRYGCILSQIQNVLKTKQVYATIFKTY